MNDALFNWLEWLKARMPNVMKDGANKLWITQAMEGYKDDCMSELIKNKDPQAMQSFLLIHAIRYLDNEGMIALAKAILERTTESITCPKCGMTSYNPNDIKHRYCGNCNQFHDGL